jgi:prevent-host-death family protein
MLDINRDIHSLTDFKKNTSEFIQQLKETGEPIVLTINGRAELVVQDAVSYQKLMEYSRQADGMEALRVSIEEMRGGQGRPMQEMFAEMEQILAAKSSR